MQPLPIRNPTYFLAPNWNYIPGGPIGLGNIIADPFRPHIVLTRPNPPEPEDSPYLQRHTEEDWKLRLGSATNVTVSLWANFVDTVGVKLGIKHKNQMSTGYTMKSLETIYYTDMPALAQVKERVKDPIIYDMMRPDNYFSKPVYMITGLKIAKAFSLSASGSSTNSGNMGASGPAGFPATIGGEVAVAVERQHDFGFDSGGDIIFAYQLMRITPKGWKEKTFQLTEYHSSAAFLSGDEDEEEPELEVESDFPEVQDLKQIYTSVTDTKVMDGEIEFACIAFKEKD